MLRALIKVFAKRESQGLCRRVASVPPRDVEQVLRVISECKQTEPAEFLTCLNKVISAALVVESENRSSELAVLWDKSGFVSFQTQMLQRLHQFSGPELVQLMATYARTRQCPEEAFKLIWAELAENLKELPTTTLFQLPLVLAPIAEARSRLQLEDVLEQYCQLLVVILENERETISLRDLYFAVFGMSQLGYKPRADVGLALRRRLSSVNLESAGDIDAYSHEKSWLVNLLLSLPVVFEFPFAAVTDPLCRIIYRRIEDLRPRALADLTLALATLQDYPIFLMSALEQVALRKCPLMTSDDQITIVWSLCVLSVFSKELVFRSLWLLSRSFAWHDFADEKKQQMRQIAISIELEATSSTIKEQLQSENIWHTLFPQDAEIPLCSFCGRNYDDSIIAMAADILRLSKADCVKKLPVVHGLYQVLARINVQDEVPIILDYTSDSQSSPTRLDPFHALRRRHLELPQPCRLVEIDIVKWHALISETEQRKWLEQELLP